MSTSTRMVLFAVTLLALIFRFFFFNDTATTEIYTLSLHDALPIYAIPGRGDRLDVLVHRPVRLAERVLQQARSEEHTSELQSQSNLVCRLLLEKKKTIKIHPTYNQLHARLLDLLPGHRFGTRLQTP